MILSLAELRRNAKTCAGRRFGLLFESLGGLRPFPAGHLRRMRVHVSDPALTGDLVTFLQRVGCIADADEPGFVRVSIPRSLREDAARLELDLYLRAWEATRSEGTAKRI